MNRIEVLVRGGAILSVVVGAAAVWAPSSANSAGAVTERVNVSSTGAQANGTSSIEAVTPDGRFVMFGSAATNLVPGDTNSRADVFLRDRTKGLTFRVSTGPGGRQANAPSQGIAISSDGRYVLFSSAASNLTRAPDTNRVADLFVKDRSTGATERVSVPPSGGQFLKSKHGLVSIGMSDDGRLVAFGGIVDGVSRTYLRDRQTNSTRPILLPKADGLTGLSGDGRWLTYITGGPNKFRFHLRNLATGKSVQVPGIPESILLLETPDAHYVVWESPVGVRRWNRLTGAVDTVVNSVVALPTGISDNGRWVTVGTHDALVSDDTNRAWDIFLRDTMTGSIDRVDLNIAGLQINSGALYSRLSGDGTVVVFQSKNPKIVHGDTNREPDIFVRSPVS